MENAKLVSTLLANHFRFSTSKCPKTTDEVNDMSKVPYTITGFSPWLNM